MNMNKAQEERDGLRSFQIITRDLPTIELQAFLESFDLTVEYSGGIMLVTRNKPL